MSKKPTPGSKKSATRKATSKKKTPTRKAVSKPKTKSASKPSRETVVAQAKADQENARLRDERAKSPDGMTASERAMAQSAPEANAKGAKKKSKAGSKPKQPKRTSLLDAAAQILGGSKEPMTCKAMVEAVTAKKLWSPSKGGKTPHATLYSAILREIKTKGKDARFKKVDRGLFTTTAKA